MGGLISRLARRVPQVRWLVPLVNQAQSSYEQYKRRKKIRSASRNPPIQLIIGKGGTECDGWIGTDIEDLDIAAENEWQRYFRAGSIDAVLAEHVWEHLDEDAALSAARNCYLFLKPSGYLRVAVPDGNHPDPHYIEQVKPGGTGAGADDHKRLYRYQELEDLFASCGFQVELLEYFDDRGEFRFNEWSPEQGFIKRSRRFDERNDNGRLQYTSIILDARKPGESI